MLEFFTHNKSDDAIAILKKDHDTVKELFTQFEEAESLNEKKKIVAKAVLELKIHATIEEEIFYPALERNKVDIDLLHEADEEHHVAKLLIAELDQMNGTEDHWEAKFIVLAENIKHHIKEEEGDMFPEARKTDIDFVALGKTLLARKEQLKKKGIPVSAEEKMISSFKGENDSPAINARKAKARKVTKKVKSNAKVVAKAKNVKKGAASRIAKAPAKKTAKKASSGRR